MLDVLGPTRRKGTHTGGHSSARRTRPLWLGIIIYNYRVADLGKTVEAGRQWVHTHM